MKVKVIEIKHYQLKNIWIRYLKDIINRLKKSDMWKIQLTVGINFISVKDNDEDRLMHSKSDSKVIMINDKASEVIKNFLNHS